MTAATNPTFTDRLETEMLVHLEALVCRQKFEAQMRSRDGFVESWLARNDEGYLRDETELAWSFWLGAYVQLQKDLLTGDNVREALRQWEQSEREGWRYADELEQERKQLAARVAYLDAQLVKEAARTAAEKLRADQMSAQHSMQAQMHRMATDELARLKMTLIP